jgi:hypothetical protein
MGASWLPGRYNSSAGSRIDRRQRVRAFVRIRRDHDHVTVPSFG